MSLKGRGRGCRVKNYSYFMLPRFYSLVAQKLLAIWNSLGMKMHKEHEMLLHVARSCSVTHLSNSSFEKLITFFFSF